MEHLVQTAKTSGVGVSWAAVDLCGCDLAALTGFYAFTFRLNPDELGIVLRFGNPVRQEPPGLHYRLPYPIDEVYLPKVTRQNVLEVCSRALGGGATNVGAERTMLTGGENIIDISFVVLWRIQDPAKYLLNLQNPEITVKDVAESAVRDCWPIRDPANPDERAAADRRDRAKAHAGYARPLRGRHAGGSGPAKG
jgi:modulator of FtsH protease HflK